MRCQGATASGSQCKRIVRIGEQYCTYHRANVYVALPSYVACTLELSLWVYTPNDPTWSPKTQLPVSVSNIATNTTYHLDKYISEGTYGVVYFGRRALDSKPIAVKVSKQLYRKTDFEHDFMREYNVYRKIRERLSGRGCEYVTKTLETCFIRTRRGLHGCLVMEKLDGDVCTLFERFDIRMERDSGGAFLELFRLWVHICNFTSRALHDMHAVQIYHLDMKPPNILYSRVEDGRGIVFRLVDMGLSGYLGGKPPILCFATGTYLPPEWRKRASGSGKDQPTFEVVTDARALEGGDKYAFCTSMYKLFKSIRAPIGFYCKDMSSLQSLLYTIDKGRDMDIRVRSTISLGQIINISTSVLNEIDAIMDKSPKDGIESLFQFVYPPPRKRRKIN